MPRTRRWHALTGSGTVGPALVRPSRGPWCTCESWPRAGPGGVGPHPPGVGPGRRPPGSLERHGAHRDGGRGCRADRGVGPALPARPRHLRHRALRRGRPGRGPVRRRDRGGGRFLRQGAEDHRPAVADRAAVVPGPRGRVRGADLPARALLDPRGHRDGGDADRPGPGGRPGPGPPDPVPPARPAQRRERLQRRLRRAAVPLRRRGRSRHYRRVHTGPGSPHRGRAGVPHRDRGGRRRSASAAGG